MYNEYNFTQEEKNIVSRFAGRNKKATIRNITRMLRFLSLEESEAALSVIAKLQESREESRLVTAANEVTDRMLERLTALRGWCLLGSTSQLHYFPV